MNSQSHLVFVWSRYLRLFHWLNVITITFLLAIGLIIFNAKALGVSVEGKILLKTIHVLIGYVFSANLLFRIVLGFFGKGYERWHKTLPFAKNFTKELAEFKQNPHKKYKGHNPLGKLMVGALLLAMFIQMITGLVIAGTDIYYPPLGQYFAKSIAIDNSKLELIKPYSKENIDEQAYASMREIRQPFITTHVYTFYTLLFLIPLHIIGVIIGERKERTGLVSSMINGYKYLPKEDK
ncbi:cytochrome b/b6 domain-containing protein [Thalassotalea profundi]|uniref:Cytochrome b561 n=1 Tax=Thalassotalea profundi TaxID=2036687 RepID=A0ABQ3ING5_9GAMM|nr:cytochrome b/b6 domain-containing protein [Thalassotalea profundi]GHE86581.1 cytochrome b561 [Thalassotalea profundi]